MGEGKTYIGTKILRAYPGRKDNQDGYYLTYPDGYESWSPKETFELCYREVTPEEKELIG